MTGDLKITGFPGLGGCTLIALDDDEAIDRFYEEHKDPRLASVKKDATVPNVGDIVRFNDTGLEQVFQSARGMSFMKQKEMRITKVAKESATYPEPTFPVEVDDPEINQFLLDNHCFDIVRRA